MPSFRERLGGLFRRGERPEQPAHEVEPERPRGGFLGRLFGRGEKQAQAPEQPAREVEPQRQAPEPERPHGGFLGRLFGHGERPEQPVREPEPQRPTPEPERPSVEVREPEVPEALRGIPPVMRLGGNGAAYTSPSGGEIMRRLGDAAALGQRVSLRVHDANGWHDLFVNPDSPGRHKASRGISADYLMGFVEGYDSLDDWIDDGGAVGEEGDTSGEDGFEEVDGYQLTVWS